MARIPNITVQGWHSDGPVYRIERRLDGWRNRKARRAGEADFDQVGHPGGRNVEDPQAFMVYAAGPDEVYAFNRGAVYEVTQRVDGEVQKILVDARENYALHNFANGIEIADAWALTDAEIAALEGETPNGDESDVTPDGDDPEQEEEQPEITDEQIDELDLEADEAIDDARDAKYVAESETPADETPADETLEDETAPDPDIEAELEQVNLDDISEEDLEALTAPAAPAEE